MNSDARSSAEIFFFLFETLIRMMAIATSARPTTDQRMIQNHGVLATIILVPFGALMLTANYIVLSL